MNLQLSFQWRAKTKGVAHQAFGRILDLWISIFRKDFPDLRILNNEAIKQKEVPFQYFF